MQCVSCLDLEDNRQRIAESICSRQAVAVSDGSLAEAFDAQIAKRENQQSYAGYLRSDPC
jgi:hypothetical protein